MKHTVNEPLVMVTERLVVWHFVNFPPVTAEAWLPPPEFFNAGEKATLAEKVQVTCPLSGMRWSSAPMQTPGRKQGTERGGTRPARPARRRHRATEQDRNSPCEPPCSARRASDTSVGGKHHDCVLATSLRASGDTGHPRRITGGTPAPRWTTPRARGKGGCRPIDAASESMFGKFFSRMGERMCSGVQATERDRPATRQHSSRLPYHCRNDLLVSKVNPDRSR